MGLINFLFKRKKLISGLNKTITNFQEFSKYLKTKSLINDDYYFSFEECLLSSDVGYNVTSELIKELKLKIEKDKILYSIDSSDAILETFAKVINNQQGYDSHLKLKNGLNVITIFGVNGAGKTTSIVKLANYYQLEGKKVMLVAADTYRAAAIDQIKIWADRINCKVYLNKDNKDPSSVVFEALTLAKSENYDVVLVDTAGRLQNNSNLLKELEKLFKVCAKFTENIFSLLALDATTGQNGLMQVNEFNSVKKIDGLVLTKLDGTSKGGIILNIKKTLGIKVLFVGIGEKIEDLEPFDFDVFINSILIGESK